MKFNSIKFEISFLYTLILGITLSIFSIVLYLILFSTVYHELDYDLKLKAEEITLSIRAYLDLEKKKSTDSLSDAVQATIAEEHKYSRWWGALGAGSRWARQQKKIDLDQVYINCVDPDEKPIVSSKNIDQELLPDFLKLVKTFKGDAPVYKNITHLTQKIRIITLPFPNKEGRPHILQVGLSLQPVMQLLQNWLYSLILSIPAILLLSSFVGWLLTDRLLKPVQQITDTAQKISLEDLSSRVKEEEYAVEMKSLVEAFNKMITRLEKSFKHIEEFSSLVAHELKTPLTIIRGETELALREESHQGKDRRVIKIVLEETARMLKTVEDLLYLAKLDYQPEIFRFETFDFIEFFHEIVEQSKILASPKRIRIAARLPSAALVIRGDRLHLRRLFFNLIDNALKFTDGGGRLEMAVTRESQSVIIAISDTGKGISETNLMKIFEKFFREDYQEFGVGLGLSIAKSIVKIHAGQIHVASKVNQGTTFTVTLPLLE